MANNITAGGFTTASDEIGGVHHQRIKIQFGAEDSATDVSTAAPLPISDAGGSLTVDGTVAVTNADLTTLAGAVVGTEVQVDVLTMPTVAVTNADIATLAGAVTSAKVQTDVVGITRPSVMRNGKTTVTTAATRVALGSGALLSGVTVKALAANTGIIYLGSSTVAAANGFELAAGEETYVDINDLGNVYIDASVSGEGVSFHGS